MDKMELEFSEEIRQLNNNEKDLKMTLDEMQKENGVLKKDLDEE